MYIMFLRRLSSTMKASSLVRMRANEWKLDWLTRYGTNVIAIDIYGLLLVTVGKKSGFNRDMTAGRCSTCKFTSSPPPPPPVATATAWFMRPTVGGWHSRHRVILSRFLHVKSSPFLEAEKKLETVLIIMLQCGIDKIRQGIESFSFSFDRSAHRGLGQSF